MSAVVRNDIDVYVIRRKSKLNRHPLFELMRSKETRSDGDTLSEEA